MHKDGPRVSLILAWGPAVAGCMGLFWLSSMQRLPGGIPTFAFDDKVAHVLAYGTLAMLFFRGLDLRPPSRLSLSKPLLALFFTVLYGASDEVHQLFVTGRHADFWDWVADAAGAFGALYFFAGLQFTWRKFHANGLG